MRDLTRELGLGTCCGKCVPEARAALSASLEAHGGSAAHGFFRSVDAEYAA